MSTKKSQILQWNKSKKDMNLLNIIRTGLRRTGNMLCFQMKLFSVFADHLEDISTIERRRINKSDLARFKKQNRVEVKINDVGVYDTVAAKTVTILFLFEFEFE